MSKNKYLIVVSGPTAVGKTGLAIDLAKHFNTEIISSDSRQIFAEMHIGTAKPTAIELNQVNHHFIGHVSIHAQPEYDVATYEKEAIAALDLLFQKHDYVIMAGGSGLYVNAVLHGIDDMPEITDEIRVQVSRDVDSNYEALLQELKDKDSVYFSEVDVQNHRRVQRAIEVIRATGKPFSTFRTGQKKARVFQVIHLALDRDRDELYARINERVDMMINEGLEQEARALYAFKGLNALQTVGYKELFEYFEGKVTLSFAMDKIKQHTRNYAKRQLTWLRKQEEVQWFHPLQWNEMLAYIHKKSR